ncbi:DUF11 domain-containing protein [Dokdonella koreensis]|uniref:DUF11 domain containing protein n=1 Tax=Dokdonella koreensis DS-123 TaxID=1300342 RepID=A0A160DTK7_9GAMM|nr:DUF11 domain-containing protein [Dokdonella koreensis]ANB17311.1 DUF11 domain containing protein [Dokdonella koreensis DS-123]
MSVRSRWVLRACLWGAVGALGGASGTALASGATTDREVNASGGAAGDGSDGLRLWWGSNSQFQARIAGQDQVYNTGARPTSAANTAGRLYNSVYLRVDRGTNGTTRIYTNDNNAAGNPFLVFTQVSQTTLGGAGTAASPWQVTTVLRPSNAADTGITVTLVDSYIRPQAWFTRRVTLSGMPASGAAIRLYQNIDTYLQGGDAGPGFVRTSPSNTTGTPDFVGVTKGSQIEALWHEPSSGTPIWDRYFTGNYDQPKWLICNGTAGSSNPCTSNTGNLNDTVDANASTDNGMAAQWNVPAGAATFTAEYRITFATSAVDLTKQFAPAVIAPGGVSTLTFTLTNRTTNAVAGINLLDTLPSGVTVAPTPNIRTSCPTGGALGTAMPSGMTVTAAAGSGTIQVAGGRINGAAVGSQLACQVAVNVTASTLGVYHNANANISNTNNLVNLVGDETLTVTLPQLTAGKSVVGTLVAGQTGAAADAYYAIGFTNSGGQPTSGAITLSDTLPAGMTAVAVSSANGTVSCPGLPVTSTLSCTFTPTAPLAPGASASIRVNVAVAASASGTATNRVGVAGGGDPDPLPDCAASASPQCATSTTPVTTQADLAVVKTGPTTVLAGQNVSYTLAVSNAGPSDAQAVVLADPTPAGLTFVSATAPCASGFPCTLGTVAAGDGLTVTVTFAVPPGHAGGPITNTATVTTSTTDPTPGNNASTATTTVGTSADLTVVKTGPASVTAGQSLTYTLLVTSAGPSTAQGVSLADPTPAGLTFVSASAPCAGGFPCALGAVAPGASIPVTVTFTVPASYAGTQVVNTATVSSATSDPDPAGNSSSATTTIAAGADLTVIKTGPASATPGDTLTYTLAVGNAGPSDAQAVVLNDPAPAGLTFVSASAPCASGFPCALGTIAAGANRSVTVTFAVPAGHSGSIVNTASVSSSTTDPDPSGNSSTVTTPTVASADIAVTKTVDEDAPNVGEPVLFTITAQNLGPSDATGVVLTDALPAGLSFVSAAAGQGSYDAGTGVWTVGALAAGDATTLQIAATVTATGTITNTATRTAADQTDPNPANNSAAATINGQPSADIQVNKTVDDATPNLGAPAVFTVSVHNAGPNDATGVVVTDLLPAGLAFQSATPSQGSYNTVTGVWMMGTVAAGATTTLTVTALVQTTTAVTNLATKTAQNEHDPNPANDQSGVVVNGQAADIQVIKVVDETEPTVGDIVTFTVTASNNGPSAATGVIVTDLLPAGLDFVDATPSQGTYDSGTGVWTIGTLAIAGPAATATLTIRATVTQDGTLVNTATRTASDRTDTNPGNDSASATVVASASANLSVVKTGPASATPGQNVSYTLAVSNGGPSDAQAVVLNDSTPAGLTFVSASAPCAGGFPCTLGTVAASGTVSVTVTFAVPASHSGSIVNTASVSSSTTDPDPSGNSSTVTTPLAASADLSVLKTGPASATPGQNVSYTLAVTNAGPSDAQAVVLNDPTPAGLTFVSASAPCAGGFPCALGTVAAGGGVSITVTFAVPASHSGSIVNTASVSSSTTDPDPSGNSSTVTTPVTASADLSVLKTGPASATPGQNVSYTLAVSNGGPSDAQAVVLSDPTPAGLTFVSASAPCAGGFPCALGTVAAGGGVSVTVTFAVPASHSGSIVNTATVSSSTTDPDPSGNSSTVTTPVAASANLSVVKTGPASATPGQNVSYTLAVSNGGPSDAQAVVLNDSTPAGLTFVSASAPCAGGFPCTLGTVAVDATVSVTVTFAIPAGHSGSIVNTATVSSSTTDPDPSGNSSTVTTPVGASADLAVVKTGPAAATPGQNVSYTLAVSNAGPSDAQAVVLNDPTPAGLTFVSASAPCAGGFPCTLGTVAAGSGVTVTVSLAVPAGYSGSIVNTATVSSSTDDPDPSGNSSTVTTPTIASADIAIAKTVDDAAPHVGETVVFTVTASNLGPSDATGIEVTDALPSGLAFDSAVATQGLYDAGTGVWSAGALAVGGEATLTITAVVTATGEIVNTATRTAADQTDPNPANNSAAAAINGLPSADIQVRKTVDNAAPNLGTAVVFTIGVRNAGPNDATGVAVTDALPAGLDFVSAQASQGSYDSASGVWTIGAIANGDEPTLAITALVQTTDAVTNTAIKTAQVENDPNPANDQAGVVVNGQAADIQLVKVVDRADPRVGDTVTFTVTATNNGPSAASGVVVTDLLPAGLQFVDAETSQGTYDAGTGAWAVGALSIAGKAAMATLTIGATVTQDGTLVNTATRTAGDQTDPNPANDSASATVKAGASADLRLVKTGPAVATAGQNVTYTLAVSNAGPSAAGNVMLDDPAPAGLTFVSASAPCAGGFPCALGTLATGGTVDVTVTFAVPPDFSAAQIVNVATATASTFDPDAGNNTGTATTGIGAAADLAVVKSGPAAATPGQPLAYVIEVTNSGPSDAVNVVLTDPTPPGLVFVAASAPCQGGFPCALGTMIVGGTTFINVTLAVPADYQGPNPILNTATVGSDTPDPDSSNNSATAAAGIGAIADLAIVKTGPAAVRPGQNVSYALRIENAGPSAAVDVVVDDPTPAGLTLVSVGAPCSGGFPCALGTLPPATPVTVEVVFAVPADYAAATIVNTATVRSATPDADPSDNASSATTAVDALVADIAVSKTGPATAVAGRTVAYTIVVRNGGPDAAADVVLDDPTPAGLSFLSASAPCASGFPCALGSLAPNAVVTITTQYVVAADHGAGQIVNIATATSTTPDPTPVNNAATAATAVTGQPAAEAVPVPATSRWMLLLAALALVMLAGLRIGRRQ